MTLVSVGIKLKLLQDLLILLETSNKYLEMSNGSLLSKQSLTLPGVNF